MTGPNLEKRRILIVEDEFIIAAALSEYFALCGAVVVGPAASVTEALRLIDAEPDINAALLDVNLGGEPAFAVANRLSADRIPFVFTSGYAHEIVRNRYPRAEILRKPYSMEDVERILADVIAAASFRKEG